jgi:choline dehydrogenase
MNDMMGSMAGRVAAGLRYALLRKGFLTIGAGYAGGFFKTDPKMATPDVQFHFILFSADAVGQKLHPWPGFLASICQLRPESRGFVRIKSADPGQAPAIQPRYLTAQADRDTMVAGMQLLRRVMGQPAIARYIDEELMPGAKLQSDADLLEFAKAKGTTVFHPTSTCRMGSDVTAVVDERLRVHGFQALRVADASIMPTVVSGNTNAACVMIGEKASDMILEDARAKPAAAAA